MVGKKVRITGQGASVVGDEYAHQQGIVMHERGMYYYVQFPDSVQFKLMEGDFKVVVDQIFDRYV